MQMLLAGLRAMPAARPSPQFTARVLARWKTFTQAPDRFPWATADLSFSGVARDRAASAGGVAPGAPAPPRPAAVPGDVEKEPCRQPRTSRVSPWIARPYNAFAVAMVLIVFVTGLVTGQKVKASRLDEASVAGMLQSMPLDEVSRQAMPVDLEAGSKCKGRPNEWNRACLRMITRRDLRGCEVHIPVPTGVFVQVDRSQYDPLQVANIQAPLNSDGQWEGRLKWCATQPGEYQTWIEIRSDGVYRRLPLKFVALP